MSNKSRSHYSGNFKRCRSSVPGTQKKIKHIFLILTCFMPRSFCLALGLWGLLLGEPPCCEKHGQP